MVFDRAERYAERCGNLSDGFILKAIHSVDLLTLVGERRKLVFL